MNFFLLTLIALGINEIDGLQCGPKSKLGSCYCATHYDSNYDLKLECPSMFPWKRRLVMKTFKEKDGHLLEISCDDLASKEDIISNVKDIDIGNIPHLRINNCPLTETFGEIIENVNGDLNKVQSLTVMFTKYEDETLKGKHFVGLRTIVNLTLNHNSIKIVDKDFFIHLPNLEVLHLNNNPGLKLHPQTLQKVPSLKVLQIASSKISALSEEIFKNLADLKKLNLHNNNLENIPAGTFSDLKSLVDLNLSNNNICSVPTGIFDGLESLNKLNLNNNPIQALPENMFYTSKNLQKFSFVNFQLQNATSLSLPSTLFQNLPIKKIHFEKGKIERLQKHFLRGCLHLETLIVKSCSIEILPIDLFEDSKDVQKIDFSGNNIAILPLSIFKGLLKLQQLNLHENRLAMLDANQFQELISLSYIKLSKNQLNNISELKFHEGIKEIDFSHNHLQCQNSLFATQSRLKNLQIINLSHNRIRNFEKCFNEDFEDLKMLDLKYNRITRDLSFKYFLKYNLSKVDLSNNQIKKIHFPSSVIKERKRKNEGNPLEVLLSNNPITCDCFATELKQHLEGKANIQQKNTLHQSISIEFHNFPCSNVTFDQLNCYYLNEECTDKCACSFNRYKKEVSVNCSHKNMQKLPTSIPNFEEETSIRLILSHNNITSADFSSLKKESLSKVTHLDLSFNAITQFDQSNLPASIKLLHLNNNKITKFNQSTVDYFKHLTNYSETSLRLSDNLYECSCVSLELFELVRSRYASVADFENIHFSCQSGNVYPISVEKEEICSNIPQILRLSLPIIIISATSFVLLILLMRFQERIEIWLFAQSWTRLFLSEDLIDKDKKYDAFISYSHYDSEYVENILWKELETPSNTKDPAYKCKVHTRDFIPGEMIPDQIIDSVHESRRTIIVLSEEYVKADWTKMEFKEAHKHSINDKRQRLILLVHGEVPSTDAMDKDLRAYVKLNAFIHTGDKEFWNKIRKSLPRQKKHETGNSESATTDVNI